MPDPQKRQDEVRGNLDRVRRRIDDACAAAGRDAGSVTLVVVTKTHPADDVRLLAGLGVADVGENREPEGGRKHGECADLPLRWHFIGQLQRNKAARVARYADFVHSVDRPELVGALNRGALAAQRSVSCLVQVDLSGEVVGRGGVAPAGVLPLCADLVAAPGLRLAGLMAVAPLGEKPAAAFGRLAQIHRSVLDEFPAATMLSAGMSGDLEDAVAAGATHVRVGTAVLGVRHNVR